MGLGEDMLLAMLAPARQPTSEQFYQLRASTWPALLARASDHRMLPMLHWRDCQMGATWPVPDHVRAVWKAAYRKAAIRSLELQRALRHLAAIFGKADIPFIALKGGWLAWHAYPEAALRPMRDIDIWVPDHLALRAYQAVLAAGGTLDLAGFSAPETAMMEAKTLPPIRCPWGNITLEIHIDITDFASTDTEDAPTMGQSDLLPDSVLDEVGGYPIRYLSPTDTLLHLMVHSALDHEFNNGPAIFDDIAFLVTRHEVDWERLWARAEEQGWRRGCELVLAATVYQQGPLPIEGPDGGALAVEAELIEVALALSLQSSDHRSTITVLGERGWRRLLGRLVPKRARLAAMMGVASDNPLAWVIWPVWLVTTGWRNARGWLNPAVRLAGRRRARLGEWLAEGGSAVRHR